MADKNDEVPEWLEKLQADGPATNTVWKEISERFGELSDLLRVLRLETEQEAIPQRHGMTTVDRGTYWHDENVKGKVRSWFTIPYDPDRDQDALSLALQTARNLAETLKPKISARQLDAETLRAWGSFNHYASIVEYEWMRERPDVRHLKGAAVQSLDEHRVWFSHLYMHLKRPRDTRRDTEGRVLDRIHDILEKDQFPEPDFPREWFEQFLSKSHEDLAASFKQNKLTVRDLARHAEEPLGDLPSIQTGRSHP